MRGKQLCGRSTMRLRGLSNARFTRTCALMLMASACSTGPRISPADVQATIPAHLLVHPSDPPKVQRTTDAAGKASMTGGQATVSITDLYAYIGPVKSQLDTLIDTIVARDLAPPPKKHYKLF